MDRCPLEKCIDKLAQMKGTNKTKTKQEEGIQDHNLYTWTLIFVFYLLLLSFTFYLFLFAISQIWFPRTPRAHMIRLSAALCLLFFLSICVGIYTCAYICEPHRSMVIIWREGRRIQHYSKMSGRFVPLLFPTVLGWHPNLGTEHLRVMGQEVTPRRDAKNPLHTYFRSSNKDVLRCGGEL